MIDLGTVTKVRPALTRWELAGAYANIRPAYRRDTVGRINLGKAAALPPPPQPARPAEPVQPRPMPAPQPTPKPAPQPTPKPAPRAIPMPALQRPVQRGQKTPLGLRQGAGGILRVGFGWNVKDGRCDVDASAFLLGNGGRVPSDDWFVFYGQPQSPDGAVRFENRADGDRQALTVDLGHLDARIQRIALVMTIDEALERRLNFGMIENAWLRVLDGSGREMVSYAPSELYENITSMTLGELYLRSGEWRFNPVGNGMDTDLAGQCAMYGVNISD